MPGCTPPGFSARAARTEDLKAVVALLNASSMELFGVKRHDPEKQRMEWRTPGFNLATDTHVVLSSEGKIVGYAEIWDVDSPHVQIHSRGRVHPEFRGLGIGSFLLEWEETRAREAISNAPPDARVTLSQSAFTQDESAKDLLQVHRFKCVRYFWRMEIELKDEIPRPILPAGIALRTFKEEDLERAVRAVRDAFKDHWGYVESPLNEEIKDWRHWINEAPDFDPSLWFLAMDGEEIAGVALCSPKAAEDPQMGWVNVLGVRRPWRRRGLALGLLRHAFRELSQRGKRKAGLGVDAASLTGATRLYEKAGMHPSRQSEVFEKELRPGIDLRRQRLEE